MDDYSEIEILRHDVEKLRKLVKELEEEVQHLRAADFVTQRELHESEARTESDFLDMLTVSDNVQHEMMSAIEHCLEILSTEVNADCSRFFLNREAVQWEQRVSKRLRNSGR